MKKLFVILFFTIALTNVAMAIDSDLVILTEKIDNPISGNGGPSKQPSVSLEIYQTDNVFFFGESFVGCAVSLLVNDVVVFSTEVNENGLVTIPETFIGTYELQLAVGDVIYWAMVEL